MPAFKNHTGRFGVPNAPAGMPIVRSRADGFSPVFEERNLQISGVTKDSAGAALGGCKVHLIDALTDLFLDETVSDASGNFAIPINKGLSQLQVTTWYLVAYKAGGTDVAGTTVNTLVGA